jgi:hypothetical protein
MPQPWGCLDWTTLMRALRGSAGLAPEDQTGDGMVAYILKPRFFYEYRPHPACVAYKAEVPDDLVFVAYVKLDAPCGASGHPVKGVLTHWQFIEAADSDLLLPGEADSRYDRRLW